MPTLEIIQRNDEASLICLQCPLVECDEKNAGCLFRLLTDRPVDKSAEQKARYEAQRKQKAARLKWRRGYQQSEKEKMREIRKRYLDRHPEQREKYRQRSREYYRRKKIA